MCVLCVVCVCVCVCVCVLGGGIGGDTSSEINESLLGDDWIFRVTECHRYTRKRQEGTQ